MSEKQNNASKNIFSIENFFYYLQKDLSLQFLIISNLLIIFFAIIGNWPVASILFLYWVESVVIGLAVFFRLIFFDNFDINSLNFNAMGINFNLKNSFSKVINIFLAIFFIFHYGFFHLVYLFFIFAFVFSLPGFSDNGFLFLLSPFFLIPLCFIIFNKLFSEIYNSGDYVGKSFQEIMFLPYGRILPMHLTLIFGAFFFILFQSHIFILIIFLLLKTCLDIKGHIIKHEKNINKIMKNK
jgi:hypothetical protein